MATVCGADTRWTGMQADRSHTDATPAALRQSFAAVPGPSSLRNNAVAPRRQHGTCLRASSQSGGIGGFFRQLQSATPIVGLLSKLFSPTGLGTEDISYPEYCRALYDANEASFAEAAEALETKYGRPAQRRYQLALLWMSRHGGGLVPAKHIPNAARRLRVSYDLEIEIERYLGARQATIEEYGMARPTARIPEQVEWALDALCRLAPGLDDGAGLSSEDEGLIVRIVAGGFTDIDGATDMAEKAAHTRAERIKAYK